MAAVEEAREAVVALGGLAIARALVMVAAVVVVVAAAAVAKRVESCPENQEAV